MLQGSLQVGIVPFSPCQGELISREWDAITWTRSCLGWTTLLVETAVYAVVAQQTWEVAPQVENQHLYGETLYDEDKST